MLSAEGRGLKVEGRGCTRGGALRRDGHGLIPRDEIRERQHEGVRRVEARARPEAERDFRGGRRAP